jgi:hypothetical protein
VRTAKRFKDSPRLPLRAAPSGNPTRPLSRPGQGTFYPAPLRPGPNIYLAHTQPGLEAVGWEEIAAKFGSTLESRSRGIQKGGIKTVHARVRELGRRSVPDRAGITIFTAPIPEPLRLLRASEDVFAVVGYGYGMSSDPAALERVATIAREAPYIEQALAGRTRLMPGTRSGHRLRYRVITRMAGEHQFRRVDLAGAISRGIGERGDHSWRLSTDAMTGCGIVSTRLLIYPVR